MLFIQTKNTINEKIFVVNVLNPSVNCHGLDSEIGTVHFNISNCYVIFKQVKIFVLRSKGADSFSNRTLLA